MESVEVPNKNNEWNFVNSVGKKGIHKVFQYPGTMVPDMLDKIISTYLEKDDRVVLDPFMGTGTVLFETIKSGRKAIGIDINPYASFGVKVKSSFYSRESIQNFFSELQKNIYETSEPDETYSFPFIEKWYTKKNIKELSIIRQCIMMIKSSKYRDFFLLSLAELAGKISNSRNSTFKLHIRKKEDIEKRNFDIIELFFDVAKTSIELVLNDSKYHYHKNISILNDNTVDLSKKSLNILNEKVDAIITSPPYGDNHTTITYGQYSYLRYCWIGIENIGITDQLQNDILKISGVDSNSAGGKLHSIKNIENSSILDFSPTLNNYYVELNELNNRNARKVASFYMDLHESLKLMLSVLKDKGICVFIVGDRKVSGKNISFKDILLELTLGLNMEMLDCIPRKIIGSYMPGSIKQEHIVIMRKNDSN